MKTPSSNISKLRVSLQSIIEERSKNTLLLRWLDHSELFLDFSEYDLWYFQIKLQLLLDITKLDNSRHSSQILVCKSLYLAKNKNNLKTLIFT